MTTLRKYLRLLRLKIKRKDFFFQLLISEHRKSKRDMDFSQHGEQVILQKLLANRNPGHYIDIGAGLPVTGSNTFFLYKVGWSGVLIDPLTKPKLLATILRPRDRFEKVAIGANERQFFYEFYPYQFSTFSQTEAEKLISTSRAILVRKKNLRFRKLSDIFESLPKNAFVFLSVDAEGLDLEVIKTLDLNIQRPRVICIEDHENETPMSSIKTYLEKNEYIHYANAGISSVYIDRQYDSLEDRGGGGI